MKIPEHVQITADIATTLRASIDNRYSQIAVLVDENTKKHCYPLIRDEIPTHSLIEIKSGEKHKTIETCCTIWDHLTKVKFDRHGLLVMLGGGVIGDMGGFAAATFKRGIDFILVPTTLLSQVDASVGGKLGVDYQGFKNHVGLFQEPKATLIAPIFLGTLSERELRSGYAEVIKHALVGDASMWNTIRKSPIKEQEWESLIAESVAFKLSVTKEDPTEKGLRKILNFGHTVGHAIESASLSTRMPLLHGEAIAVGMITESQIAYKKNLISREALDEIADYIISIFDRMALQEDEVILKVMRQDKKNKENKILMALVNPIGQAVWDVEVSEKEICNSLAYYRSL
ncbi:MAG: 3-dehydroquinate synthase [Cyclobacteriaceae bacterium]